MKLILLFLCGLLPWTSFGATWEYSESSDFALKHHGYKVGYSGKIILKVRDHEDPILQVSFLGADIKILLDVSKTEIQLNDFAEKLRNLLQVDPSGLVQLHPDTGEKCDLKFGLLLPDFLNSVSVSSSDDQIACWNRQSKIVSVLLDFLGCPTEEKNRVFDRLFITRDWKTPIEDLKALALKKPGFNSSDLSMWIEKIESKFPEYFRSRFLLDTALFLRTLGVNIVGQLHFDMAQSIAQELVDSRPSYLSESEYLEALGLIAYHSFSQIPVESRTAKQNEEIILYALYTQNADFLNRACSMMIPGKHTESSAKPNLQLETLDEDDQGEPEDWAKLQAKNLVALCKFASHIIVQPQSPQLTQPTVSPEQQTILQAEPEILH